MKINQSVYYAHAGANGNPENLAQLQKMLAAVQERIVKLEQGNAQPEGVEEKEQRNKQVSQAERKSMVAQELKRLREQAESLQKRIQAAQGKAPQAPAWPK